MHKSNWASLLTKICSIVCSRYERVLIKDNITRCIPTVTPACMATWLQSFLYSCRLSYVGFSLSAMFIQVFIKVHDCVHVQTSVIRHHICRWAPEQQVLTHRLRQDETHRSVTDLFWKKSFCSPLSLIQLSWHLSVSPPTGRLLKTATGTTVVVFGEVRGFTASLSKVFHQWQHTIFPLDGAALSSVCSITTADSGFHLSHSLPRKLILPPELGVEKWGSPLQTSYHLSFLIFWKSADTKHLALDHTYEGIRMVSATFVSSVDCQHKSVPQWGAVWGKEQVKKER